MIAGLIKKADNLGPEIRESYRRTELTWRNGDPAHFEVFKNMLASIDNDAANNDGKLKPSSSSRLAELGCYLKKLSDRLASDLKYQSLPLKQQTRLSVAGLGDVLIKYIHISMKPVDSRFDFLPWVSKSKRRRAAETLTFFVDLTLLFAVARMPLPIDYWRLLKDLNDKLRDMGGEEEKIDVLDENANAHDVFVTLCLFYAANPFSFKTDWAAYYFRSLLQLSEHVQYSRPTTGPAFTLPWIWYLPVHNNEPPGQFIQNDLNYHCFDLSAMGSQAYKHSDVACLNGHYKGDGDALLHHIHKTLKGKVARREPRRSSQKYLQVMSLVDWWENQGEGEYESQTAQFSGHLNSEGDELTISLLDDGPLSDGGQSRATEVFAKGEGRFLGDDPWSACPQKLAFETPHGHHEAKFFKMLNESHNGLRLLSTDGEFKISVDQVVMLQKENSPLWDLGVIRWSTQNHLAETEFGVMIFMKSVSKVGLISRHSTSRSASIIVIGQPSSETRCPTHSVALCHGSDTQLRVGDEFMIMRTRSRLVSMKKMDMGSIYRLAAFNFVEAKIKAVT